MNFVRFTLRINKKIDDVLKKLADEMNVSKNSLINLIISDYFKDM